MFYLNENHLNITNVMHTHCALCNVQVHCGRVRPEVKIVFISLMYGHHHHRLILFGETHVDGIEIKKNIKSDADAYAYAQARICWNFIICHTIYRTHNQHCHVNVMAGANCFVFRLFFFSFLSTKFVTAIDLRFFRNRDNSTTTTLGRFFAFTILVVKFWRTWR